MLAVGDVCLWLALATAARVFGVDLVNVAMAARKPPQNP